LRYDQLTVRALTVVACAMVTDTVSARLEGLSARSIRLATYPDG
jgi:hypothetical protein